MRWKSILIVPLAACSPAPEPAYSPPTHAEAMTAYRAGQLADADILEAHIRADPAQTQIGKFDQWSELETLRDPDMVRALTIGSCDWEWVDTSSLTESSRQRLGSDKTAAYRCDGVLKLSAFEMTTLPAPLKGYFFRDPSQRWVFAEIH